MNPRQATIEDAADLLNDEYYHGYLPREEINKLLRKEGLYVVRTTKYKADKGDFGLVLSVRTAKEIAHFVVYITQSKYFFVSPNKLLPSVTELVAFYQSTGTPINSRTNARLLVPIARQNWEIHSNQIVIGKKLGEGAFGQVCEGAYISDGTEIKVALKLLKGAGVTKESIKEISKEVRLLRSFNHPNIVHFYGAVYDKEPIIVVLELANGGSLDVFLRKNKCGESTKLRICIDAASGLAYIHSKGCIHKDIAARNCLVSNGHVKISDFGLSSIGNQMKEKSKKVPIRWLAPETLGAGRVYSFKSDVFSFGVLLWEIYTDAEKPYAKLTNEQVYRNVSGGYRLSPPPSMPQQVTIIMIVGCFLANPESRCTMAEIQSQLEEVLTGGNSEKTADEFSGSIT